VKKFPDFVPPTKVSYLDRGPTLHLRRCMLQGVDDPTQEWTFDKEEIRIGSMEDNDIVLHDDTVSRYHCKIVQDDTGYVLVDNRSTNGTFINKVRVREAFLKPGAILSAGQSQLRFNAKEEEVQIVPSRSDRCAGLIGGNSRMREIYSIIEKIAPTATTVVIDGETGTGKEVVAQAIHSLSPRSRNDLVVFDCGAVPPNLIESELFGHEKGSFTGAVMTRSGLFEQADGGTLFLDEVGELPVSLQPKVLRALQEQTFDRLGGTVPIQVDARVVAATNRDLRAMLAANTFREDLFFRLDVFRVRVPALRERASDVPLLAAAILRRTAAELNKPVPVLSPASLERLTHYPWPGNVRELENCLERAVILAEGSTIEPTHLNLPTTPLQVRPEAPADPWDQIDLSGTLDDATRRVVLEVEKRKIAAALQDTNDDALRAAELLGMAPRLLVKKVRTLGLKARSGTA
jgi:transcriptional regulator with GAF, ATPase, and Fis domain